MPQRMVQMETFNQIAGQLASTRQLANRGYTWAEQEIEALERELLRASVKAAKEASEFDEWVAEATPINWGELI